MSKDVRDVGRHIMVAPRAIESSKSDTHILGFFRGKSQGCGRKVRKPVVLTAAATSCVSRVSRRFHAVALLVMTFPHKGHLGLGIRLTGDAV